MILRIRISYKLKLILVLGFILLIAFLSVSYINYRTARSTIVNELVHSSLPLTRENIYSEIIRLLMPLIHNSHLMAHDSFLINWAAEGEKNTDGIIQYLQEIKKQYGYFSTFFVSAKTQNYYYYEGILKQVSREDSHDIWYYSFIDSGLEYDLDVDTNQAANEKLTIFINVRVDDFDGTLLGVTGVGMEMEGFSRILKAKQEEYSRSIYLVDRTGMIQAHPDMKLIEEHSIFTRSGIKDVALQLLMEHDEPINSTFARNGESILVTSRYLKELDWFLIVEQNETKALAAVRKNLYMTLLTGLVTSLIIIAISAFTVNLFQSRLEYLSKTDELTQTANRRECNDQFKKMEYRFVRYGTEFSVILIDLDNFKLINDTQGHIKGDEILKSTADIIRNNIRPTDIASRWGGDEFIILTECPKEKAWESARRIRDEINSSNLGITISCGISQFKNNDTLESLTQQADKALYASKNSGRDRITMA